MTTRYDPDRHHRRSIRLKGYDYSSPGAYFVTVCTRGRECVLDDPVVTGIITDVWHALPGWFPTIILDEFVVMPNHVHLIVWLQEDDTVGVTLAVALDAGTSNRAGASPAPTETGDGAVVSSWVIPDPETVNLTPTLGEVMGAFKSLVFTVYLDWIQAHDPTRRAKFWQRNYYEHIIRNERELHAIRRYIRDNPIQWALDRDNPHNLRGLPLPTRVEDYLADVQALLEDENGG
jgi:putative transposase